MISIHILTTTTGTIACTPALAEAAGVTAEGVRKARTSVGSAVAEAGRSVGAEAACSALATCAWCCSR